MISSFKEKCVWERKEVIERRKTTISQNVNRFFDVAVRTYLESENCTTGYELYPTDKRSPSIFGDAL